MTTLTVPPECVGCVCVCICCVSEALSHRAIEEMVHWTITRRSLNRVCVFVHVHCNFHIRLGRCLFIGPVNPSQLTGINLWIIILYQFPYASAFIIIYKNIYYPANIHYFYCCHCLKFEFMFIHFIFFFFFFSLLFFSAFLFVCSFCSLLSVNLGPKFRKYVELPFLHTHIHWI